LSTKRLGELLSVTGLSGVENILGCGIFLKCVKLKRWNMKREEVAYVFIFSLFKKSSQK